MRLCGLLIKDGERAAVSAGSISRYSKSSFGRALRASPSPPPPSPGTESAARVQEAAEGAASPEVADGGSAYSGGCHFRDELASGVVMSRSRGSAVEGPRDARMVC